MKNILGILGRIIAEIIFIISPAVLIVIVGIAGILVLITDKLWFKPKRVK